MEKNEQVQNEIQYRETLLKKGYRKLTIAEKTWLQTHAIYSIKYGYPYLQAQVIEIKPNVIYKLTVSLNRKKAFHRITPTIRIPMEKGFILFDGLIKDQSGKVYDSSKATILSTNTDEEHPRVQLTLLSELGYFMVYFHSMNLTKQYSEPHSISSIYSERLVPSITIPYFAMECTKTKYNRLRCACSTSREQFIVVYEFDIEWTETE